ncbi:putative MFS-type transporter YhjX [Candidatus Izimaplasma bacterium HR1]|jgi:OFA family oxalate/formate antiporter-like MFS transporter|uniref:L-lactate MFS transporter n=1 Tax=Candidatus Izimoplasma sp. HR1 TaxID=1541959 RepID=UPI0004F8167D|nr:putative MFS-type transporter YhjX [Candidatus Izimaplasma bacterium HR1]
MNYRIRNKWIVSFAAIMVQVAIGALYAWSLFNEPISEAFGVSKDVVVITYSVSLLSFALATILSGRLQLKIGPRFTTLMGGLLYTSGILLSSFATDPLMLYITYGVIAGAGVGFVYVCPLSTLVKWFPNRKGLVTGVATASFAIGGFVFKILIGNMFDIGDALYTNELVSSVFLTLAVIYGVMTIGGALLLDVPEKEIPVTKACKVQNWDHTTKDMLKTTNFYKLLLSDLLALMPGLLIIGLAKDIGTDFVGLEYGQAAGIVGLIALFNAGARLSSGIIADKIGALKVYRTMYFITIIALAILAFVPLSYPLFLLAILGIVLGYGSFLSLVPTIVGRLFGGKFFSANYSLIFQAYGIAALIGPIIKRESSSYNMTFMIAMGAAIAGLVVAMLIKDIKEDEVEVVCEELELAYNN